MWAASAFSNTWACNRSSDVFAAATLGPAYAWAHLHLHSKRGRSPYRFPELGPISHPADSARMTAIASALRKIGHGAEMNAVEARWLELVDRTESECPPEYHRCYPDDLLETGVEIDQVEPEKGAGGDVRFHGVDCSVAQGPVDAHQMSVHGKESCPWPLSVR